MVCSLTRTCFSLSGVSSMKFLRFFWHCSLCIVLLLVVMPTSGKAGNDSHIHGRGQAKVKITGDKVVIRLLLPVHSILGFEREPQTEEQRQALARAEAMLLQASNVIGLAAASKCQLTTKALKVKRFKKKKHHKHADFVLTFKFSCLHPTALNKIQFMLFDNFPRLQNLDVVFSSNAKKAHAKELTRRQDTLKITGE